MQCKIFDTHPWGASSGWSTGCSDGGLKHSAGQVAKVQASPPISGIIPLHIHINAMLVQFNGFKDDWFSLGELANQRY